MAVGFLDPTAPKKLMPRLNQLVNRAQLTEEEIHILRGIARAMGSAKQRAPGGRALSAQSTDAAVRAPATERNGPAGPARR